MLYTVGHRVSYEQGLREQGAAFQKVGKGLHKGTDYAGGIVFLSLQEAQNALAEKGLTTTYSPYGLVTEIGNTSSIRTVPGGSWRTVR